MTRLDRATVTRLRIAPVKGLALIERQEVEVGPEGVGDDRRFYLVGPDGRNRSGLAYGPLARIVPDYDAATEQLTLRFPDGTVLTNDASGGNDVVHVPWTDRVLHARPVPGFDTALTDYVGMPMRLVRAEAGHRPSSAHVTIISQASLETLERGADLPEPLDDRRFRMLVTIDGIGAFAEDAWVGSTVAVGDAAVRVNIEAARCGTTTRDPATGLRDVDMLRILADVRGVSARQTVDLGVYCEVVRPGRIAVGDEVRRLQAESAA
jgi:uncharacterized protein